jgi:hypothetical protein
LSSAFAEAVIVQRLCHPLREKGKCHRDGKGDIEKQGTEAIERVGLESN